MIEPQRARSSDKGAERSYTLALEGATYQGSVALIAASSVVAERSLRVDDSGISRIGRGERLMPAVAECLEEAGVKRGEIARIVCGAGPGSFTSLRVAGSVAKGLAVGYEVDLFAVSSLLLTVSGARQQLPPGEYLSVLDAMRGEFFAARVQVGPDGSATQVEPTRILNGNQLREFAAGHDAVRIVGPGQEGDAHPHARGVAGVISAVIDAGPVDLPSWEPDYGRLAEAQVRWEAAHGRALGR